MAGLGIEHTFVLACPTVVVCQRSLFDSGEPSGPFGLVGGPCRPASPAPREWLDGGAWIEFESHWLTGSHSLFEQLLASVPWRAERRRMYDRIVDVPRLVSYYGEADELPDRVAEVKLALCQRYRDESAAPFRTVGACLYRGGGDSVAWHGDTIGSRSGDETLVGIVSLGEPRRFLLRPKGGGPGAPVQPRARGSPGHGGQVPAHLGALGAEDHTVRGSPHQRPVPIGRRRVNPGVSRGGSCATGVTVGRVSQVETTTGPQGRGR